MNNKITVGGVFSFIYFIIMAPWIFLLIPLVTIMCVVYMFNVVSIGFAMQSALVFIPFMAILLSPSFLIPPLRRMYYKVPWLQSYVITLFLDMSIVVIGLEIINCGFATVNSPMQIPFIILTIVWLIAARIAMCFLLKKFPFKYVGADNQ